MTWTPERKEQQRELAKRLVEEGKFGGANRGQGRPRKRRASEEAAELLAGEGRAIYDALMEVLENGTDSNRILAVREIRAIEEAERKIELHDEQSEIDGMKHDELLVLLTTLLGEGVKKGVIPKEFDIDGEAEPVTIERASEVDEAASESN